jgi:hypothetical protein
MRIVIPTPVIHGIVHPDALTRGETEDIAQGHAAALAAMRVRIGRTEVETLPEPECSCQSR